jgi:5-methylcytosine-specific restriction endonuclease McrA
LTKLPSLLAVVAAGAAMATAATASPPHGATARCHDGTYSTAQHRSAACTRHGGVAKWLRGSGATRRRRIKRRSVVLLAPRTRKSGCRLDALPDRRCSPGAYSPRVTKAAICSSHFSMRHIRKIPRSERYAVERRYGLPTGSYRRGLEIDHIVPLRIGGSNNIANLFPEEYAFADHSPGYVIKDRLDMALQALVCVGRIPLRTAQRRIAANWEQLYQEVFGRSPA